MIGEALPKAVGCGQDLAARENMLLASCMAGMAFSSAGLGLCHAMAHQPGAALHIPHGLANAMLLPTVMEFNRMVRRARFSQIGRALTGKKTDDREAIAAVRELIAEVGLTMRLTEAGATSALRRPGASGAGGHLFAHQSTHRQPGADYRAVRGGAINADFPGGVWLWLSGSCCA